MLSFQNAWPIKRKAVYTLVHFHIFIHYLDQIGSHATCVFFNTTYLTLVTFKWLQVVRSVASDGKFYQLPPIIIDWAVINML